MLSGNYQNLKFYTLKNYRLNAVNGSTWSDFVMTNQTIESISIKWISPGDYDHEVFGKELKIVCEVLPNLKHLKLCRNMNNKMHHVQSIKKSIQISFY